MVREGKDERPTGGSVVSPGAEEWRAAGVRDYDEMIAVIEAILTRLAPAGFSRKELFGVRLALEEAIVNAIRHGHQGDTSKVVQVRYRVDERSLLAEVEDQGRGFNPDSIADPLAEENLEKPNGRGLLLMRNYMDEVCYNARGNCVRLRKGQHG